MNRGVASRPRLFEPQAGMRLIALGFAIACGGRSKPPEVVPSAANTTMINRDGRRIGTAAVLPSSSGGLLVLKLTGVPPGTHGLHLHTNGVCDPPNFDTAGPHYEPGSRKHGSKNPAGPHAGDMPNVVSRADSSVDTTLSIPASAVSAIGSGRAARSLVLHAGPDDLATDPSGNSGARFACGVLER
jgi:superoxide dismutase, Cu-Zn family